MTVPFVLMTIAWLIMLIVVIRQKRRIKGLSEKYQDLYDKGWAEHYGVGKEYKRKYKFVVVENAGDNLNLIVKNYQDEGYNLDDHKSTDRLLVFVKFEEVRPGYKNL